MPGAAQTVSNVESVDLRAASAYLHRSERSVRRYLQAGRLQHVQEALPAGGFRYLVSLASLEVLKAELDGAQGVRAGGSSAGPDSTAAHLQALHDVVQTQADRIAELTAQVEALTVKVGELVPLLPAAPGPDAGPAEVPAPAPKPRRWWQWSSRRRGEGETGHEG